MANQIMDVESFEKELDGKMVKFRRCLCRRHKKHCDKKGDPVITKASSGYSNPFSHAVSVENHPEPRVLTIN